MNEDVFPIEHGDFSKCHVNFHGVYLILVHLKLALFPKRSFGLIVGFYLRDVTH